MLKKKIIPYINIEKEDPANIISMVQDYVDKGADELFLCNYTKKAGKRDEFLSLVKELVKIVEIPFVIGCYVERFEDVKKAFYTGAHAVVIQKQTLEETSVVREASKRFGKEAIWMEFTGDEFLQGSTEQLNTRIKELGIGKLMLQQAKLSEALEQRINQIPIHVMIQDGFDENNIEDCLSLNNVEGIATDDYKGQDLKVVKDQLQSKGYKVNRYESKLSFSEFKLNKEGLIPVITQDIKTGDVLMLAYMNEEAYNKTIASGKMTYFSRSRGTLWLKGETSGHFQYVKELTIDCDKDTLLAKVAQVGVACHTGNPSCFYRNLIENNHKRTDSYHVFEEVYQVIMDRKNNPKEGSYTNYLFNKGIDKILKKCGEEAAEIIIAAKNPEKEELRYEIADFLYHMMVLMAECGLDWNDVVDELAHRK